MSNTTDADYDNELDVSITYIETVTRKTSIYVDKRDVQQFHKLQEDADVSAKQVQEFLEDGDLDDWIDDGFNEVGGEDRSLINVSLG